AGERGGVVAADVGAPGRKAAHRGALAGTDRRLQPCPRPFLVAGPETVDDRLRAHRPGAKDRRPSTQDCRHVARVDERLRVRPGAEVALAAPVGLEAVAPERDGGARPPLELARHRRLEEVDDELLDRTEELRARVADVALRLWRDPEHEPQTAAVHLVDQSLRVGEAVRVEGERAD